LPSNAIAKVIQEDLADVSRKLMRYIRAYANVAKPIRWTYRDLSHRIRINVISGTAH